ncbi:MAG TPA: Stk1 family PASTA domain-containing Ser/Thr kinase [Acidimicrobiales bacterium]|nr:Stk1 family PASTA domain-containing Ser/Thr kinase [Acidimicrobiales bacterium]
MADRVLSGRYQVVRHLARGGMAEVYLAHDQLLDRRVAVKVLFPDLAQDGSFVERFRREARAAAGLNHQNIVSVYDFGEDDGSYYIVMEYVDGPTLRDIIRSEGPFEPVRAAEVGADVAAALAVAHQHGIIHRDVKPGNVLLADSLVKVADFGIARAGDPRESLTMTGAVMGTATYLSPEQAQGNPIDHRSDLYSLGVVLYEMLAGRPPFSGDSPVAIAYRHLSEDALPPSTHNSAVPPALDAAVLRAMAKDPDARYESAAQLRADLLAVAQGAGEADETVVAAPVVAAAGAGSTQILPPLTEATAVAPPAVPPYARPPADDVSRRRRRAAIGVAALVLLAVVAALALLADNDDGDRVTVPRVVGLDVEQARQALDRVDLRSVVEEADRPGTANQVLEQRPEGQTETDRTTTVTLVIPAPSTTVPTTAPRVTTTRRVTTTVAAEEPATTAAPPATQPPATLPPRTNPTRTVPTLPTVTRPTIGGG